MKRELSESGGNTMLNVIMIVLIVLVIAAAFCQVPPRAREAARKAACQNNMKELGLAVAMYYGDYDAMLPSSALNGSKTWDPSRYRVFATARGVIPPEKGSKPVTWPMVLYPFMKNKDIIWCPQDPNGPIADLGFWRSHFGGRPKIGPNSTVSYWWKAAIDRAWFAGNKKDGDFDFPSDQVLFYEHTGWHWGDEGKGLSEGATLNMTFMDGHVASKRLKNAGNAYGKSDPLAPGEPGWFNADMTKVPPKMLGAGKNFDARRQGDYLP